jgi:addiction module RelB/DinJ family antitoxin
VSLEKNGSFWLKPRYDMLDIAYYMFYNVYTFHLRRLFNMAKDTSISIRTDSRLKEQTEKILDQLGLNITAVVNMLFHQIVREEAVPLSLTLKPKSHAMDELNSAIAHRLAGYVGRSADEVADDIERIITEAENGKR